MAGIITLTTDFGTRDPWVAIMKGVILGIAPGARLIDVTHEVAPHDVLEAALALEAAAPFFSEGTVHLAVVDPGVGSARRGLVVSTGGHWFVGPDNGVFTPFLDDARGWRAIELTAPWCRAEVVSPTFHGRDVFAPAAAHLARGVSLERFGPDVRDPVRLPWPGASREADLVRGEVVHVDRFGNLTTSLRAEDVSSGDVAEIAGRELAIVGTYSELAPGGLGAVIGSAGRLEIAAREGRAAALLSLGRGAAVVVRRGRR